jgi:hypothetical protein
MQHVETLQSSFRSRCGNQALPHLVKNFLNRIFTKENTTSSLMESSSPFFLQEFRILVLLKTNDRFTSLMFIRVTKIMCCRDPPKYEVRTE